MKIDETLKMKSFDIYLSYLKPEIQKKILIMLPLAKPHDGNYDIFPITEITERDIEDFNIVVQGRNKERRKL